MCLQGFRSRCSLLAVIAAITVALVGHVKPVNAQISKAAQILLNRGVELQAMVQFNDIFTLTTYSNANYTSVNWFDPGWQQYLGPAPGFPWGRWVSDPTDMPPKDANNQLGFNAETPDMSQLINLELGDELNLNDGPTRTNEINWFNSVRSNFPNTILFINNFGGQASDAALGDMISKGHPDMICFDTYPFLADYTTRVPNTWPFTSWFGDMWRYRQWGIGTGTPVGAYMQTFHSVEDYDQRVYRVPSPSELRFNNFAALAFNAKMLIGFVYNSGAAALFDILPNGYSGDTYTNALYGEQADVNHRATILGRTLVCLKPIPDLHNPNDTNPPAGPASGNVNFADGTTTSILLLKGNPGTDTNTPEPVGFVDDPPATKSFSWWEFQKNDPYLNGWTVINKGTNNGGSPGQVIISWFKLLDESLDGPAYTNEIYFMVVNALTANHGTAADCLQEIKLNFQTGTSAITAVNLLDPETGLVTTNTMPVIAGSGSSTKRQLVLDLNGGDAALFKFADGAPFVGHVQPAAPRLSASRQGGFPAITVQGTLLARYKLQSSPTASGPNWSTVSTRLFTNSSTVFVDATATNTRTIFYRAVGIP